MIGSLPSHPLQRTDIAQLRTHETVDGFIELESPEHASRNGGLRKAVALTGGTIVGLSFEDDAWKQTVLARDVDKQDHLEEALRQLEPR